MFILVQCCRTDTTREWLAMTRTTRTGRETMVTYISLVSQQFNFYSTTRTGRETMVRHESYNW